MDSVVYIIHIMCSAVYKLFFFIILRLHSTVVLSNDILHYCCLFFELWVFVILPIVQYLPPSNKEVNFQNSLCVFYLY